MNRRFLALICLLASALLSACGSSATNRGTATVTLDAMSGLPNPTWTLDANQVSDLVGQWDGLAADTVIDYPSVLGYRGIVVDFEDGSRMWVSGGTAVDQSDGSREARSDADHSLELWLLGTGAGTVDASLLESIRAEIEG